MDKNVIIIHINKQGIIKPRFSTRTLYNKLRDLWMSEQHILSVTHAILRGVIPPFYYYNVLLMWLLIGRLLPTI